MTMQSKRDHETWKPQQISLKEISSLIKKHPEIFIVDEIKSDLEELFLLRNPKYRFDKDYQQEFNKFLELHNREDFGNWFYFPWLNTLIHYLPEDIHQELRTGRNKYLITKKEQSRFYEATIAFMGLSVGSHIAAVIAITGGARKMKLVDPDVFSGDNLNRIRTGFHSVGIKKVIVIARQIHEINPYSQIEIYPEGLLENNALEILQGSELIIEEMDNPYWKIKVRELGRERGIPVLMATDNGDGIIVDIERYDLRKETPILNGFVKSLTAEKLKNMSPKDLPRIAGKIAGANLVTPRMLYSVSEVGKSLYSWPQLGTAANMCGSVIGMLARRIINKDTKIKSGRYSVNPDRIFEAGYNLRWISRKIAFIKFLKKMM